MGQVYTIPTGIHAGGLYVDIPLDTVGNIVVFTWILILMLVFALIEFVDVHVPYSKFAAQDDESLNALGRLQQFTKARVNSRLGFFILYSMPFWSYLIMWICFAAQNLNAIGQVAPSPTYSIVLLIGWLSSFAKRCLEVLFVHIYSGDIPLVSMVSIGASYSMMGLASLYYSNQVVGYDAFGPATAVKDSICVVIYIIGFLGNLSAHYQLRLARLRQASQGDNAKKYFGPQEIGPLFTWFICPHYLFEILIFIGFHTFSGTSIGYMMSIGTFGYLTGRTRSTYRWYATKGLLSSSSRDHKLLAISPSNNGGEDEKA